MHLCMHPSTCANTHTHTHTHTHTRTHLSYIYIKLYRCTISVAAHPIILILEKQINDDCCEFKGIQGYKDY